MEAIELPYMKLLPTACVPTHAILKSIGLDLYSPTSVLVPAHNKVLINMGIAFQIPMGYYGQIAPRSGLALHHHIHVGAGWWTLTTLALSRCCYWISIPEPCYRSKSSHSPINSGENCLPNFLWSATNTSNRLWYPWIWFNRAINE